MTEQPKTIISKEKEEQTGVLNLNNCGLTEIPIEVFEMEWVQVLNLSNGRYWDRHDRVFRNMPAVAHGSQRNAFNLNTPIHIPDNVKVLSFGYSIIEILHNCKIDLNYIKALDLAMNKLHNLDFIINSDSLLLLDLFNNQFQKISPILEKFQGLKKINLRHNDFSEIEENVVPNNLEVLLLGQNKIKKIENLSQFFQLKSLDLSVNEINIIEGLDKLELLEDLSLAKNRISKIENLWSNKNLKSLSLGSNAIYKIENISCLEKLSKLKIKNAKISEIEDLEDLKYLNHLDLSSNKIALIDTLYKNHNLNYVNLGDNPISSHYGLVLKPFEDHWPSLRNYFERQNEKDKVNIQLPVKVLLLGNHASGKSTLLHYIKTGKLDKDQESTHILNIDFYNIDQSENEIFEIPDAIFYDFGGQDYYHGIYKTFLSKDSLYIILWKNSTNKNEWIMDTNGLPCTRFNLDYWFGQKKYLEVERWGQSDTPNPSYIIQSHFETDGKKNTYIEIDENGIINEYALSLEIEKNLGLQELNNSPKYSDLHAFKEALNFKLTELKVKKQEPKWYIEFLSFIFNAPHSHFPYTIDDILPYYKLLMDSKYDKIERLKVDLDQLHLKGVVLYYKEINPNLVWLSPSQFAEYVHTQLLSKEIIKNNFGMIDKDKFEENLSNGGEAYIIEILKTQKVIFFDENESNYIIPGYLKISSDDADYLLFSHGTLSHQFTLKFKNYLPFGFMNQLICFYGVLPGIKRYWRDEIIFTIGDIKIQIKLDFCKLEVNVNFIDSTGKNELESIRNYLFYSIVSLYWDLETLDFLNFKLYLENELDKENVSGYDPLCNQMIDYDTLVQNPGCRPSDLKVSLDGKHFISYQNFWEDCKQETVTCWIIDKEGNLSGQKTTDSGTFRYLFKNKYFDFNITKIFKIAISYAKEDHSASLYGYNPIQELYDNLSIIGRDYNLEIFIDWNIDENNWDRQIREKFNEADLIMVMNSSNYNKLEKRYIWEVEMPIINSKYENKELSILRINITDCFASKDVSKFNDFKKEALPSEINQRASFFKNLIKEKVQPQIEDYAK